MPRFTVAVAILLVATAVAFFFIVPQWEQVAKLRASITRLRLLHDELQELVALRDELSEDYTSIPEGDLGRLRAIAPSHPSISSALVDLETLSTQHGMNLERIDFLDAERSRSANLAPGAARFTTPIPLTMGLKGGYDSFRAFLTALEQNLRIVDVEEVNLTSSDGVNFSLAVRGAMYYRR